MVRVISNSPCFFLYRYKDLHHLPRDLRSAHSLMQSLFVALTVLITIEADLFISVDVPYLTVFSTLCQVFQQLVKHISNTLLTKLYVNTACAITYMPKRLSQI